MFEFDEGLVAALNSKITIMDKGEQRTITKFEGGMIQLSNKFVSGDLRSMRLILKWREASLERAAVTNNVLVLIRLFLEISQSLT